jgi:hypothetical protein
VSEQDWITGNRAAYAAMIAECCRQLGVNDPAARAVRWIKEREEAVAVLRRLCKDHGDNEWEEDLHLADIIGKHLGRYLGGIVPPKKGRE